jgi:flagellar protein FliO/FliZ
MTKLTLPSRAAATAAATFAPCLLGCARALAWPSSAAAAGKPAPGSSEDLPVFKSSAGSALSSSHSSTGGASLVRTIVGLAIVIAVIWGLTWILRQVKAGRDPHVTSAGLASVAALTLGSGRSVHLVRAGSEYVLLGSAEHGLVPIHRYTEQEARDAGLLVAQERPAGSRRAALLNPRPPAGERHDPMSMPSPGPGTTVLERLREWTVRR